MGLNTSVKEAFLLGTIVNPSKRVMGAPVTTRAKCEQLHPAALASDSDTSTAGKLAEAELLPPDTSGANSTAPTVKEPSAAAGTPRRDSEVASHVASLIG